MKKFILRAFITILVTAIFWPSIVAGQKLNAEADAWAKKTLAGLSLEKKVAQLVCAEISGNYVADDDPKFQSWISLAHDHGIGGFVIYGGTPQSVGMLLNKLQKVAELPILISTDFEGGPGQQVTGASEFPSNMAFAATGDTGLMYRAAKIMGSEGRAMGIQLTYTPVTDISLSFENPQESGRSFGGDLDLQNKMIRAYVRAFHEEGMLTTSKHFPGRGNMTGGPVYPSITTLNKTEAELNAQEFTAFQNAVNAGVDFMMTEYINVPSITGGSTLPAMVEPKLVKGVIRNKLHFKGLITSDDLWYDNVVARFGKDEVAVMALAAGHDIALKPKDPVTAMQAIVEAVKNGRLSQGQIDSSVYKMLYQKFSLGLCKNRMVNVEHISSIVGTTAHKAVIQEVADRSLTLLRNENVFPLKNWNPAKTVHITIQKDDDQPNVKTLITSLTTAFPELKHYSLKPGMAGSYYDEAAKAAEAADLVIFSFFVQRTRHGDPAPLRETDLTLINNIIAGKPGKVVAMSFGNPHLLRKISKVPSFIVGYGEGGFYGNQPVYFNSFIKILKGELVPAGKLPLAVSADLPIGFGLTYKN